MKYNLILTEKCNKNCSYCYNKNKKHENYDILPMMHKIPNGSSVNVTGGEPVLHPQFNKILMKLKNKNVKYTILSNLITNSEINMLCVDNIVVNLGCVSNDDEYAILTNNINKYIPMKSLNISFVLSNDKETLENHKKYLTNFLKEFYNKIINQLTIFVTLEHPKNLESNFDEYIKNSKSYIEDLSNIIHIKNANARISAKVKITLECGGLYKCLFENSKVYNFVKENVDSLVSGCDKTNIDTLYIRNDNCYVCPPSEELWNEKISELSINSKNGKNAVSRYKNIGMPETCAKCVYYINKECYGPCLGFYKKN